MEKRKALQKTKTVHDIYIIFTVLVKRYCRCKASPVLYYEEGEDEQRQL
jgi:hypothetical protein